MAQNNLELGMFVKQSTPDQSECVRRRLYAKSPRGTEEPGVTFIRLLLAEKWLAGMQIDRHIEFLHVCPELPIHWNIKVVGGVLLPDLREAADQGADKAKLLHATGEFPDSFVRVLQWQRRE